MTFLVFKTSYLLPKNNSPMPQVIFFDKLESELKRRRFFIERSDTKIVYRPKVKSALLTEENRRYHIIREGCIEIEEKDKGYLIKSSIDLTKHLIFTIFVGLLCSFALGYSFNHDILFMTISTISITTLFFITGYFKAKQQADKLIKFIIKDLN